MNPQTLTAFPLLADAMQLKGADGRGACFHRAAALVLDLPYADLCVGTLRGVVASDPDWIQSDANNSPTPFIHAWVEKGEELFAPTTVERAGGQLVGFPREAYYQFNGVRDVYRLNRAGVKRLAEQHGWFRARPFGNGAHTEEPLGRVILREMNVPHEISRRGGVVPIGYGDAE